MQQKILTIFIGLLFHHCYGQKNNSLGIDCNPKLNNQEIIFFDSLFKNENFDFKNKVVGFAIPSIINFFGFIRTPGFNKSFLPATKKDYFKCLETDIKGKNCSKLLILDDSLKKATYGFDAIIIFFPRKKEKKLSNKTTLMITDVFSYNKLNYPDNLNIVGNDTSNILNDEEVVFLNTVYQHDQSKCDFTNKKVVFIDYYSKRIIPKMEYINQVKKYFENNYRYPLDHLVILDEKERSECGNDIAILPPVLRYKREEIVEIIKFHQ